MDRRTNCYLNSAYNNDYDDYIETASQLSFDSKGQSYESENETYVDEFLDDYTICYTEDTRIPTIEPRATRSSINSSQKLRYEAINADSFNESISSKHDISKLTSTPKKQQIRPQLICSPSGRKLPHRRNTLVRSQSICMPGRNIESTFVENNHLSPNIRRSKSSLSLSKQRYEDPRPRDQRQVVKLTAGQSHPRGVSRSKSFHNFTEPSIQRTVRSVSPFQIRESNADLYGSRRSNQSFLRRPYDLNSSFSSTRPLMSQRNLAVISPIYKKTSSHSVELDSTLRNAFTIAADRSTSSSCKSAWVQVKKQTIPLCTLRSSAITLLISGTLSCLFCLHIISMKGKSYELTFSLFSGFVALLLGFPCLRFQEWQWLPNRNYVSGYVVLSLFSVMQTCALWIMDQLPDLEPEYLDLIRGVLYALSGLSLGIALLGVSSSCCCKYPPPDNRVTHGVQGFTV
ncbi:uncharacterized protein LOC135842073 [Planococcus citri]|uniref:uncharacterized protein LOC135842073 n=1 Tax=Planococcus citri TaxID=170843 RepID=UPI0031F87FCA